MKDKIIKIPPQTVEQDIVVELPNGKTITLQYRDYEGTKQECKASVDIILSSPANVYNWFGVSMTPAKILYKKKHIHYANQLCICF